GISFLLLLVTNFIMVNVFSIVKLVVLGPFFSLILVGFVFYAITKYRFLDIRLIIVRSVTYVLLLAIVTLIYILGTFVAFRYIFPSLEVSGEIYWLILSLSLA